MDKSVLCKGLVNRLAEMRKLAAGFEEVDRSDQRNRESLIHKLHMAELSARQYGGLMPEPGEMTSLEI